VVGGKFTRLVRPLETDKDSNNHCLASNNNWSANMIPNGLTSEDTRASTVSCKDQSVYTYYWERSATAKLIQIIIGVLLFSFGVDAHSSPTKDSCQDQIPAHLSTSIMQKFPGYRPPLATDNLSEDIDWNIKEGGKGCLGVAIADFDGDGSKDFLLGLTSLGSEGALVVVALTRGSSWNLHTLDRWKDGRARLYVTAEKPGSFNRTGSLDGPLEPGERKSINCTNWGALFGATESSGVVYCFTRGKWHHVWVSD
jgi:hypothetical protein